MTQTETAILLERCMEAKEKETRRQSKTEDNKFNSQVRQTTNTNDKNQPKKKGKKHHAKSKNDLNPSFEYDKDDEQRQIIKPNIFDRSLLDCMYEMYNFGDTPLFVGKWSCFSFLFSNFNFEAFTVYSYFYL